LTLCSWAQHNP